MSLAKVKADNERLRAQLAKYEAATGMSSVGVDRILAEYKDKMGLCAEHLAMSVHKSGQAIAMMYRGESGWQGAVKRAYHEMSAAWALAEAQMEKDEELLREIEREAGELD